jgi:integrase
MPILDKKRKTWTGRVRISGFPVTTKRGFITKTAAKEWERKEKIKLTNPQETPLSFSQASTDYLLYCQKRQQKNTYRQKAFIIKSLIESWGEDKAVSDIKPLDIEEYLDLRFEMVSGKSANRDLREINTLFNWLIRKKYILENPATSIERYKEKSFSKYVPPREDLNKVMLAANGKEYDILQSIYHTGARAIEIRRLKWEDINFKNRTIKLWTRKRKTGALEADELFINNILYEILDTLYKNRDKHSSYVFPNKSGGRFSKNTLDNLMPNLFKHINQYQDEEGRWVDKAEDEQIKPFGLNAIRHYVASLMVAGNELSLADVQKQMRHKRATTTDTYIKSFQNAETNAAKFIERTQNIIPLKQNRKAQNKKNGSIYGSTK